MSISYDVVLSSVYHLLAFSLNLCLNNRIRNPSKKVLEAIGLEPERVEMYNLSAAQGARFAEIAREFTERIHQLGPSPVGSGAKAA